MPSCSKTTTTESHRRIVIAGRHVRPASFLGLPLVACRLRCAVGAHDDREEAFFRRTGRHFASCITCWTAAKCMADTAKSSRSSAQFQWCVAKQSIVVGGTRDVSFAVAPEPSRDPSRASNGRVGAPRISHCIDLSRNVARFLQLDTRAPARRGLLARSCGARCRRAWGLVHMPPGEKKLRGVVDTFKNRD